jgi:hypothetical protein
MSSATLTKFHLPRCKKQKYFPICIDHARIKMHFSLSHESRLSAHQEKKLLAAYCQCKLVISHTAVQNLVSSRRTKDESKRETCPFNNRRQRFSSYAAALSQFEDTEIERLHGKFHSLMHTDEMSPNQ